MKLRRIAAVIMVSCIMAASLTGCSYTHVYNGTADDGSSAQIVTCTDGTYTLAVLSIEDKGDYKLITKYSASGDYDGEYEGADIQMEYQTRYVVQIYEAKGNTEASLKAAAEAYNESKPLDEWKTEDVISSKEAGSKEYSDYILYYNDDSYTLSREYHYEEPQILNAELSGDVFAMDANVFLDE